MPVMDNTVTVDLSKGIRFSSVDIGEADSYANRFGAKVVAFGQNVDLTGASAQGLFIREDGSTIFIQGGVEDGVAFVVLTPDCYATVGRYKLTLKLIYDNEMTTLRMVEGRVLRARAGTYGGGTGGGVSGGSVEVDATLTQPGKAADAKVTGDRISGKLDATKLPEAVNSALAQAKESGEFDGEPGDPGERGHGILKVTTTPTSYTTTTGGKAPIKRMALSTIKSQANVDEVLVGDQISHSYYLYHVYYLDETYAYMDTYQSIRGAKGDDGDPGPKGDAGDSGVHVGSEPPTGGQNVWIDPTGEPDGEVSGGVQPDWNQTDETQPDFIRNRPFGETQIVIFEEQTVMLDGGFGVGAANGCPSIGSAVTVTWNGTAYNCITQDLMGFPAVGNIDAFNATGDTGEPFVIIFEASSNSMQVFEMSGSEISVLIKVDGVVANMLQSKYYTIATVMYSDGTYLYRDVSLSTKYTSDQFMKTLQSAYIVCHYDGMFAGLISGGRETDMDSNTNGYGHFMFGDSLLKLYTAEYTPKS